MKILSEETIKKISISKQEAGRERILQSLTSNENIVPKQSQVELAIPSHRTRECISFDIFKDLISKGESLKDLKEKYSSHLMSFYSLLAQGKMTLSKEDFETQYKKGISLDEISKGSNISREHIGYLREYYGIKRKGANFIKRLQNETPLNQEAKDIIIGSLLGDGHITKDGYFSEKHSEKQSKYLEWKASFLVSILSDNAFTLDKTFDKRYGSINYSFCLRTIVHSFLHEMREKFYKKINNKWIKIIPDDIENLINEKVLAIWFMDDGHTDWLYRNGIKKYANALPQCKFSSESFSFEENMKLKDILKSYSIDCNISFRDHIQKINPYIRITCKSSVVFRMLIKPFVQPELLYKVDEKEYLEYRLKIFDKELIAKNFADKHNIKIKNY